VDLLGSRLSSSFTQRAFAVNQLGVYPLRVGQFEPTITRVVLEVDPTAGDWETTYDPQKGGVNILPAGGESQASLLPSTPTNYQGSLATIQSVQLKDNFLTIVADGFLFYRSGWDPVSGGYRISVTPAQLPSTLPNPGLPLNGPVDRIRFVQETPQTVSILVQPARQFNVIEEAPGQGTRRIQLQLQPLDGSPVATAPLPATPPPPNQTPLPATIPEALPVPVPNKNRGEIRIAIDPGHGGRDPGAIGVGGIQEKKITFAVSTMVAELLRQAGFTVIMLRTDDSEVLLKTRVDEAVRQQADILVSIHANALNRSNVYGMETYYLRPDSARLAQVLHKHMVQGTGATDRGIRRARFYVVRETPTTMPSVLLEMGYVTNPTEGPLLTTPEYQAKIARSIAQGIQAYFSPQ
jgi:N-acetylmuramoyl-L-alanine amidase